MFIWWLSAKPGVRESIPFSSSARPRRQHSNKKGWRKTRKDWKQKRKCRGKTWKVWKKTRKVGKNRRKVWKNKRKFREKKRIVRKTNEKKHEMFGKTSSVLCQIFCRWREEGVGMYFVPKAFKKKEVEQKS